MYLSGVSMPVHQALPVATVAANRFFGSRTRSKLYLTSSLVNSRPVWNWASLRRLSLICVWSALTSQLSASRGSGLSSSS